MGNKLIDQFKIRVAEYLVYQHAWSICDDYNVPSITEGCALYDAIDRHIHRIVDIGSMRQARIEALRAELNALEQEQQNEQ